LVFQIVDFSYVNDLKFTYVHLQFQIFTGVYTLNPRESVTKGKIGEGGDGRGGERRRGEGRGGEGKGREGRGWDGLNPPKNKSCLYGPVRVCIAPMDGSRLLFTN
jgi:hypothetical protein